MTHQSTNTNSGAPYVSNDGDVHKSKVGQVIDNITPSKNDSNTHSGLGQTGQHSAGGFGSNTGSGLGQTGQHSNTGYGSSNTGYGSNTGALGQSNQQYVANDGDVHKTAIGAKFDSATPSSNSNTAGYGPSNTAGYGSSNTTGLGSHNTTSAGYGSSNTTAHGSNNEQYLSNSGETHKTKIGAKIDDMTPNSGSNTHNSNSGLTGSHSTNSGLTGSSTHGQHSTGAGYGSSTGSGLGQSNQQHVANDGDLHKTAIGAKVDSATPSSNNNSQGQYYGSGPTTGSHSTTHGTHNTAGSHSALGGHDSTHKPTMMDKVKGTAEELMGKATKNPEKVAHGQAVAGKGANTL